MRMISMDESWSDGDDFLLCKEVEKYEKCVEATTTEVLKNGIEIAVSDSSNAEGPVQLISTVVKRKRGKGDLCSELEDDGLPDNLDKKTEGFTPLKQHCMNKASQLVSANGVDQFQLVDQSEISSDIFVECATRPKRFRKSVESENTKDDAATTTTNACSNNIIHEEDAVSQAVDTCTNGSCKAITLCTLKNNEKESCETDFAEEFTENDLSVVATLEKTQKSPLSSFRPGYLWVSDLTRQNWCEQQLYYSFTVPGLVEEKPVMTEGTNLHLERELAVHDVVDVRVTSNEDIWGIKVLNLINSLQGFLNGGTVAREIPIFGAPFNEGVFIVGLIDELRFDPEMYLMELWELKTRKRKSMPSKAQCVQHRLQVMLYKKLFDDLVRGNLAKETIAKHLRLDLKKTFGDDVFKQVASNFLTSKDLSELMDVLFSKVQCLTCIQEIGVEYVHQDSKDTIGMSRESYSDEELEKLYKEYLKFWRGERCSTGVDIEDAWKCQSCDFADICDWRKKKAEEYSKKNIV